MTVPSRGGRAHRPSCTNVHDDPCMCTLGREERRVAGRLWHLALATGFVASVACSSSAHLLVWGPSGGGAVRRRVMTMQKLTAGAGYRYLLRTIATGDCRRPGADPVTAGNPPGRWIGRGLAGLGAAGATGAPGLPAGTVVDEQAMARLFGHGADPLTGAALGRAFRATTSPADRIATAVAALPGGVDAQERSGRLVRPVGVPPACGGALAVRIRSSQRARRRCRSSRSGSCPRTVLVANAVIASRRRPRKRSCAPGCGRSLRTMTRIPVGQPLRSIRSVSSATLAPRRLVSQFRTL